MSRSQLTVFSIGLALAVGLFLNMPPAESAQAGKVGPKSADVQKILDKAVAYLKTSQGKNGEFSPKVAGPGITAIAVAALIRNGVGPDEPIVANGLKYLESQAKADGGIHSADRDFLTNYTTAVAVMALKEANTGGKYDAAIKRAADYIKKIQHTEDGLNRGGFGYKKGDKGDLSNTAFSVEALLAAGLSKDDPAVKNALQFISNCQNLPGEKNEQPFAKKTTADDKGGMTYNPNMSDKNKFKTDAGGLRSLGGMTYSGLKSFLYAGVSRDDPRVKAAVSWCRNHYTLEENPGMGKTGLYYYYHTFSKAMDAFGEDLFEDAKGVKHDWRLELFQALQKQQQANGSWRNVGDKGFAEDNADLSTAFALLSLSYCKKR